MTEPNEAAWNRNRDQIIQGWEESQATVRRLNEERARWQVERTALVLGLQQAIRYAEADLAPEMILDHLRGLVVDPGQDDPSACACVGGGCVRCSAAHQPPFTPTPSDGTLIGDLAFAYETGGWRGIEAAVRSLQQEAVAAAVAAVRADLALTLQTMAHGRPHYLSPALESTRQATLLEAAAAIEALP